MLAEILIILFVALMFIFPQILVALIAAVIIYLIYRTLVDIATIPFRMTKRYLSDTRKKRILRSKYKISMSTRNRFHAGTGSGFLIVRR